MRWLKLHWHSCLVNYHIQLMTDAVDPDEKSRQYMKIIYHQRKLNKLLFE